MGDGSIAAGPDRRREKIAARYSRKRISMSRFW
jgi:hypothetical protein